MTRGITVVDDYGHHPTEIDATRTARLCGPTAGWWHLPAASLYPRASPLAEFCPPLLAADVLLLTEVYGAGEPPIPG